MLVLALILAVVVWVGTVIYWLVNRKRKPLPAPQNFDQLQARIDQLEERLRQAQARQTPAPAAGRRALNELRQEVERTQVRGDQLPPAIREQLDSVENLFEGMFTGPTSAFGRLTRDLRRSLRDPNTTWSVTTTTTTREAPTTRHGQVPPEGRPAAPAPPAAPRPPTRTRAPEPTVPDRPVQGRSVYERLRDQWPTPTTSEAPEEPQSRPGRKTTS